MPVVDDDACAGHGDAGADGGVQGDSAGRAWEVGAHELVAAWGDERDLPNPRRACLDDGGKLGHRAPPAAAPNRIVGIALLELDPDAGAGRG